MLCLDEAPWKLRFVTHLDLHEGDVEEAAEIVARVVERAADPSAVPAAG